MEDVVGTHWNSFHHMDVITGFSITQSAIQATAAWITKRNLNIKWLLSVKHSINILTGQNKRKILHYHFLGL